MVFFLITLLISPAVNDDISNLLFSLSISFEVCSAGLSLKIINKNNSRLEIKVDVEVSLS